MIRSDLLKITQPTSALTPPLTPLTPLQLILAEQQDLTAVERFARAHDQHGGLPAQATHYSELIPLSAPQAGQQYAFDVDLDLCTGCKACVTGCHNLNGLDPGEIWRTVGLLHGGTSHTPAQQTVTTACHHCLEPACLEGCPVKAYEKDPITGIVKHLDDQCIGCQYCIFMCPYDAPKFSKARGIVRKCDMCSDRLAHQEAPACVQSCPNQAIRITVVDRAEAVETAESNAFLPGAPAPSDTLPTTVYRTSRALPRNMLPADFYSVSPEHAHPPLVLMLTLTQLSVGAFWLNLIANLTGVVAGGALGLTNAIFALVLGLAAMGASTVHLGRPQYAFRAFLGLRTSWLSREIVAFSLFALLASLHATAMFLDGPALAPTTAALAWAAAAAGAGGVFCSVMVYAATRRSHWRGSLTGFKFCTSALILGAATVLAVSSAVVVLGPDSNLRFHDLVASGTLHRLAWLLLAVSGLKLVSEVALFRHLRDSHHSVGRRIANLMAGDLRGFTRARLLCGAAGGLVLPAILLRLLAADPAPGWLPAALCAGSFLLCLAGELCERALFFAAAPASRMPGGLS
jgi:Fe-S-cluster-containing dehydrogenase component/DMSO reductase anchor subunit